MTNKKKYLYKGKASSVYRLGNSLTEMALIIEWIISSQRRKECEERQKTRP